jgi:hypothetical protein
MPGTELMLIYMTSYTVSCFLSRYFNRDASVGNLTSVPINILRQTQDNTWGNVILSAIRREESL